MDLSLHLHRLLAKAGLKNEEVLLYSYILEHKGCSIMDVVKACGIPKTTAYRAFESLKNKMLIQSDASSWKNNTQTLSLKNLIKKLENNQKNTRHLIHELKILNSIKTISKDPLSVPQIEVFKGKNAFEKYLDLSEMPWQTNFSFGNWEDLNQNGNLVPVEKKFIKNRLKKGANAYSYIMKGGHCTSEITDYDKFENRISKTKNHRDYQPLWINAFEGNNWVYLWRRTEDRRQTEGTLIDSKSVADFYKDYIFSLLV